MLQYKLTSFVPRLFLREESAVCRKLDDVYAIPGNGEEMSQLVVRGGSVGGGGRVVAARGVGEGDLA